MRIDWTLSGCTQEDERAIARAWESSQPALEARIAATREEDAELLIGIYHELDPEDTGTPEWDVQAALSLPAGTLPAESAADDLQQAIETVVGELGRQLDELEDRPIEVGTRRERLEAILPFLERYHAANRSDTFFAFVQPVMRSFQPYVRRELAVLRSEGALAGEGLESSEVLDEALLRAWDRFDRRPRDGRFDLWLLRLINEALSGYQRSVPHESLEARVPVPQPEPHEDVDEDTWTEQAAYSETLELADVLAGREGLEAWDRLDVETRQTGLERLLGALAPEQRHALILSAAEGYEPAEIADIQDRPVDDVLADIALARDVLRRQFQTVDDLEDIEDRLDDPHARHPHRRKG